ncbi:uncharacterized protein B0I36DRAFT_356101 [Microdochium trichocladiopsis]|uniref:Uncharacterized protein n=1 Tax=Microdochium trichocladiopsis TaxID=1682393 RepID=A0A9P8XRF3_9PEZI|nr:uncharacterized protein B0I36DRAFT_356101 [Microdochium trichocladiopsis]KAH7012735.1 hypothetical protein B0I36DRAFT_356101 [Microdochium trichocladiopsis]
MSSQVVDPMRWQLWNISGLIVTPRLNHAGFVDTPSVHFNSALQYGWVRLQDHYSDRPSTMGFSPTQRENRTAPVVFFTIHRLIFGLFSGRGLPKSSPRSPSPISGVLGSSGKYAGNIIGGLMQGLGMALAGACASTVLVQAGLGTYPGLYTISGAAAGGFLFVPISSWIQKRNAAMKTEEMGFDQKGKAADPPKLTVYEQIGISRSTCILATEAAQVVMIRGLALHKNGSYTAHRRLQMRLQTWLDDCSTCSGLWSCSNFILVYVESKKY